jgi:hypothetical protein
MGHPDGAHTHGGGGGSVIVAAIAIIFGAAAAVAIAQAVAKAVAPALAELVLAVSITLAVLVCLAVTGVLALLGVRVYRWHQANPVRQPVAGPPPARVIAASAEPAAIEAPRRLPAGTVPGWAMKGASDGSTAEGRQARRRHGRLERSQEGQWHTQSRIQRHR